MIIFLCIFIVLLFVVITYLVYCIGESRQTINHYHEQWQEWERKWYEVQAAVSDELGYHISPSGLKSPMKLSKHK